MLREIEHLKAFTGVAPCLAASLTAIGNFDGLHLGHRQLLSILLNSPLRSSSVPSLVLTFRPRPEVFFRQHQGLTHEEDSLFTSAQKKRALFEIGIDAVLEQPFDLQFSRLSPEEFYHSLLRTYLGAKLIVVGDNFFFGYQRGGNSQWLRKQTSSDGIHLCIVAPARHKDEIISSTRVRSALRAGEVELAAELLGRPYLLEGITVPGSQQGRLLGFPTLNLRVEEQLIPRHGVYAGYVWLNSSPTSAAHPQIFPRLSELIPAAFNIGVRPTLHSTHPQRQIEAHLLHGIYPQELYQRTCGFYLSHFLRPEHRFAHVNELKEQISKDISIARAKLHV